MSPAETINNLADEPLRTALAKCCASTAWVEQMMQSRPFSNDAALESRAAKCWNILARSDWLEAFEAHPKIGDVESLRAKYANTSEWADREQSGVADGSTDTLQALADLNREYEAKFGYIFIVCATGKSADEMLTILRGRLPNDATTELRIAAGEQLKITKLRLAKLAT